MHDDIVPELLERIKKDFNKLLQKSSAIKDLQKRLQTKEATYIDVNNYAIEVGNILSTAINKYVTEDVLPDGRMYYNIANRLLNAVLPNNHDLITGYGSSVQKLLNDKAKISLVPQVPTLNQDKIDGLVNRLSHERDFRKAKWLLGDPIVTFSQGIVDDIIEKNVDFHYKSGLRPQIIRKESGNCCDWCRALVGKFDYPDVPKDVYRRHGNCRCTVEYDPKSGKRQNIWSKKWSPNAKSDIERRQRLGESIRDNNRKADIKEYKEIVDVLGVEKSPVSVAKFQDLKYNKREEYERLKDKVFITEKIKKGEWGVRINLDKQNPHVESTRKPGKSYIYDSLDPQKLFNEYAGTGRLERDRYGRPTNKEIINLDYVIGVNASDGSKATAFKIHHSRDRTHIVPKKGD